MTKILLAAAALFFLPQLCWAATAENVYIHVNKTDLISGERVKIYGYVTPRQAEVKVRIFERNIEHGWTLLTTENTGTGGRWHYYATPEQDAYYRAKIKVDGRWTWGNKRKSVNVRQYPACGDDYIWFEELLLAEGVFSNIVPLGAVNPSGHTFPTDHLYFYLNDYTAINNIYAPTDIWVEQIVTVEHLSEDPVFTDYSIDFRPCAKVHGFLGHVFGISETLQEAWDQGTANGECSEYSAGGQDYRRCAQTVRQKLSAGDIIGTVGGNLEQSAALDWGVYDLRAEITGTANESRWFDQRLYNVCPLDYYESETKDLFYSYLGDGTNPRVGEPLCGTIHQDVAGTAQGRWFLEGTEEGWSWTEDHQLALMHDYIDYTEGMFSVGDSISSLASQTYNFTPTNSGYVDRDFDEVTADGQIYCYNTDGADILLQLTSATTLRIESQALGGCGSGPWFFTDDYTDFER